MNDACARWIEVSDRHAVGDALQEGELAFLHDHAASCAHCTAESAVWDDFAGVLDASEAEPAPLPVRPRMRSKRRYVALAFAAAAAVALAFVRPSGHAPVQFQAHATGALELDGRPAGEGALVQVGALLRARADGACLRIDPGIRACLAPQSVLRVVGLGSQRRLELLNGQVVAELEPQPAGTSFGVLTRDSSAIAVGTAFSVELSASGATVTRVLHGTVVVRSGRREHRLTAGSMVTSGSQPRAIEAEDEQPVPAPAVVEQVASTPQLASTEELVAPSQAATRPQREVRAHPADARPTATELLASAREQRANGDVEAALAAYERLFQQYPGSAEAHASSVPYAELLLTNGRARDALGGFERYLAQPGALAEEAAFGRVRALRALGEAELEQAAIARFLTEYPHSPLASGLRARAQGVP